MGFKSSKSLKAYPILYSLTLCVLFSLVLANEPGEVEAFQYKIVCLIQKNDFQNALAHLDKNKNHSG